MHKGSKMIFERSKVRQTDRPWNKSCISPKSDGFRLQLRGWACFTQREGLLTTGSITSGRMLRCASLRNSRFMCIYFCHACMHVCVCMHVRLYVMHGSMSVKWEAVMQHQGYACLYTKESVQAASRYAWLSTIHMNKDLKRSYQYNNSQPHTWALHEHLDAYLDAFTHTHEEEEEVFRCASA